MGAKAATCHQKPMRNAVTTQELSCETVSHKVLSPYDRKYLNMDLHDTTGGIIIMKAADLCKTIKNCFSNDNMLKLIMATGFCLL